MLVRYPFGNTNKTSEGPALPSSERCRVRMATRFFATPCDMGREGSSQSEPTAAISRPVLELGKVKDPASERQA